MKRFTEKADAVMKRLNSPILALALLAGSICLAVYAWNHPGGERDAFDSLLDHSLQDAAIHEQAESKLQESPMALYRAGKISNAKLKSLQAQAWLEIWDQRE